MELTMQDKRSRPASKIWLRSVPSAVLGAFPERLRPDIAILLGLCIVVVSVAFGGIAAAGAQDLIPDGQFESVGALGVAVDQSTSASDTSQGHVYTAGFLSAEEGGGLVFGELSAFDGSGNRLAPSPFGQALAYGGAAVNPVNGDLYALEALSSTINIYNPVTGEPGEPGSFPVPPSSNYVIPGLGVATTVVGIASDAAGDVYVPVVPSNEVLEYSPTGEPLKTFTGGTGTGALSGPMGVVIDSEGNLWVADTGNNRIEELSPADVPVREIASEGVDSVALGAHDDVIAIVNNSADFCGVITAPCAHLVEYSPAGVQLTDLGAGSLGSDQFNPQNHEGRQKQAVPDMVAVSDSTGYVYVTEPLLAQHGESHGRVLKFRPPIAPAVENETAVEVGGSDAKLGAIVNPGGVNAAYRFEYGATTAYGNSVPVPQGDTGGGFTSRTVWTGVAGLQPGTTYHYRVVVTGAVGEPVSGMDQTFTTPTAVQAACPNGRFRTGFSAALPDCRAYELVTPPNKSGAQPDGALGGGSGGAISLVQTLKNNFAAVDGNRLSFRQKDILPSSHSAAEPYVATRGTDSWSEENIFPTTNYYGYKCVEDGALDTLGFSEDLTKEIISVAGGGGCDVEPELVSGEPHGSSNLFVRDNVTDAYQLVNVTPAGVVPAVPALLGTSPDYSRIFFEEKARLTPEAPVGVNDIYEWNAGEVHLVTILPDGTPVAGSFDGISSDGSRVFFTAGGDLYARVNGINTVQLDASDAAGVGGGGSFTSANHDGSVVLFTDDALAGLTSDTQPGSGKNLYRYDFSAPAGQQLTDLTPVAHAVAPVVSGVGNDGSAVVFTDDASAKLTSDTQTGSGTNLYRYDSGAPADVRLTDLTPGSSAEVQQVIGVSKDGSSVYFKAKGSLPATHANQYGESAQNGQPNLYLSHGDETTFIAVDDGGEFARLKVTTNGEFLAFEAFRKLTPYDNIDQSTGQPAVEIYLYDAAIDSLACASCNPVGTRPTSGGPGFHSNQNQGAFEGEGRAPHNLSENGQLFFDSAESLLPADTNSVHGCSMSSGAPACTDVYEFEPGGVGSCAESSGCLYLISTGTSALETFFVDANPTGSDVFIRENQKLVARATEEGVPSLYDVRVDGGFPEPPSLPPCTTADGCRPGSGSQPGIFGAPASQTFSGVGNLASPTAPTPKTKPKPKLVKCKKGHVKKGKCIRKSAKKARKSSHSDKKTGK